MPSINEWTGLIVAIATVVGIVLAWWWRHRDDQRRRDEERRDVIRRARTAASLTAKRWRLSMLSTVNAYQDPDLRQILKSVREWRKEMPADLATIEAACPNGTSLPARQIQQGVDALMAFQVVIEPLATQYQPDMTVLYEKDPAWKARVDEALTVLQAAMAPILGLSSLSDDQLTQPAREVQLG